MSVILATGSTDRSLAHLNVVQLEIVDERPDVDVGGAVFGLYCFVGAPDPAGRRLGPFPLAVGERRWFPLAAPGEHGVQSIGIQFALGPDGKPMRVQAECRRDGFERPWNVPLTVPVEFSSGLVTGSSTDPS